MVFIDRDGLEQELKLSSAGARIAAAAGYLRRSCSAGEPIGLLFGSRPELVVNWLACLAAGLRPLILQYHNAKQNHRYWLDSVSHTVELVGLGQLLVDSAANTTGLRGSFRVIEQADIDRESAPANVPEQELTFPPFEILQLSSGTTGFRKPISFDSDSLWKHVLDFNTALRLDSSDVIVSWLPLYHDMGFIACFVMPLFLGVKIVMMDPATWVRNPNLLTHAIERHSGTVCYMPNFGFEVMSRIPSRPLPTMRAWISCSEPVSAATAKKFLEHMKAPADSVWPCYAMAENIFAVSVRQGIQTQVINTAEVVSCGSPILNVEVKIVDGEIWVKSPVSLHNYVGGQDLRDGDGFYPTGDLGEIIGGELFISGRKLDLLIQAGRKFLLSDLDLRVNEILPDVRGRVATVATADERLGTEVACVLVEARDFFERVDHAEVERQLKATAGIDQIVVHFVPPRFLTKTTSGKINRKKTLLDWRIAQNHQTRQSGKTKTDPVRDLEESFAGVSWESPVATVLDSLSLTVLHMLTADRGIEFTGDDTLQTIKAKLQKTVAPGDPGETAKGIRIVSIAERLLFDQLNDHHLDVLGDMLGVPVSFEHVCLPPSAIVLSDLIFCDYFMPRLESESFACVQHALDKLRSASLIIVDDSSEMFYPPEQVYGVLSHNLERDPRADLISVRWQSYSQMHDRLPITVVRGGDMALEDCSKSIAALSRYLSVPILTIANFNGFSSFTKEWEWRPLRGHARAFEPAELLTQLASWLKQRLPTLPLRSMEGARLNLADAIHYCSHAVRKDAIDLVLEHFDSFCIAGRSSSLPYIRHRLAEMGKPLIYLPSYAPEIVRSAVEKFQCLLICGAMGDFEIEVPAVAFQHVALGWRTKNLERFGDKFAHLNVHGSMEDAPESGSDWFYQQALTWARNRDEWEKVRMGSG